MAVMTDLRLSLWQAIDAWPALRNVFVKKWRFDETHALDHFPPVPAIGEVPAIAIYPAQGQTAWALNQHHQFAYAFTVSVWTHDWTLAQGEALYEEIVKAWYQVKGGNGNAPVVDHRLVIGGLSIAPMSAVNNSGVLTNFIWSVTLPAFWQPQLS